MNIKAIVISMRLRTLLLSMAGVLCGAFIAFNQGGFSWPVAIFLILTTASLQILSNMSNEMGDFLSGTDGDHRVGPNYSLSGGRANVSDHKRIIILFVFLSIFFGSLLVYFVFGTLFSLPALLMLLLGAAAIWAAVHYTLGKNPYGYRGFGDISVFIFFGFVAVLGGYFVLARSFTTPAVILPAVAFGCFSVGVLNINNIRDRETDMATRVTIPIKIGARNAKIYQTLLIVVGWLCMLAYTFISAPLSPWHFLYLLSLPIFIKHLIGVWRFSNAALDPMLPLLVIATFIMSILFGVGLIIA